MKVDSAAGTSGSISGALAPNSFKLQATGQPVSYGITTGLN